MLLLGYPWISGSPNSDSIDGDQQILEVGTRSQTFLPNAGSPLLTWEVGEPEAFLLPNLD